MVKYIAEVKCDNCDTVKTVGCTRYDIADDAKVKPDGWFAVGKPNPFIPRLVYCSVDCVEHGKTKYIEAQVKGLLEHCLANAVATDFGPPGSFAFYGRNQRGTVVEFFDIEY